MGTVIFDFDGTIADSFTTLLGIFEDITKRQQKLTPAEVSKLRSQSLRDIMKYLKIKNWQIPRLLIKAKRQIGLKIADIEPFEDLAVVLKKLHQQGHQMYILSTNSAPNISSFLKANGLDPYFVKIYGDSGLRSKSASLKKLIKKEHLVLSECTYIGDEVRDVEAGQKVGIPVIAVGWGFNHPETLKKAKPSYLVMKPAGLLEIL